MTSFLGIRELPERARGLILKAVVTGLLMDAIFALSSTFYVLHVIDTAGIEVLGVLLALRYIFQAVLDYPTGVLGDWIGQRWLLFLAYLTFGLSFGLLVIADSLFLFVIVYLLFAFASSQASGAFMTWLDNNYKIAVKVSDPLRKTYRYFRGRWLVLTDLVSASSYLLGGVLATIILREVVFALQALGLLVLAISFLFIITDYPEVERQEKTVSNYFRLLGSGLKVVFADRTVLLLLVGICWSAAPLAIWGEMIAFPLYFAYTGSDGVASTFRFLVWISALPLTGLAATIAAKTDIRKQPWFIAGYYFLFCGSASIITFFFPFQNRFEFIALILVFITFVTIPTLYRIDSLLQQRIFLDLIPDQNRNAVYSLIPTAVLIVASPTILLGGLLLKTLGTSLTIIVIGIIGMSSSVFFFLAIRTLSPEIT